jgi:DNA modification methylase
VSVRILIGDCRERLKELPDCSVDSVVCDPPYHLTSIVKRFGSETAAPAKVGKTGAYARASKGFMGQTWDGGDVAFRPETWAEVLRVLKPGGFLIAFGGDRTFHRLAVAVEDAGFDYRGTLAWIFGSGFPKSRNVSKDLADLPACSCDVSDNHGSVVNPVPPTSLLRATVGTESVSMLPAGCAADGTRGLGLEPSAEALGRQATVESGIEGAVGHFDPVVLGPLNVAGVAEGQEVAGDVSVGEVEPKALRDEMVDDQALGCSAVGADPISSNDLGTEILPSDALVSPLLATPGGIGIADEASSVISGHAGAGAVSSGQPALEPVGLEVASARLADEDGHAAESSTSTFGLQCERCGGVKTNQVPQGLGTALKPAMELICLARKPLSEKSVAANVLTHGTGALNIDGCRIETTEADARDVGRSINRNVRAGQDWGMNRRESEVVESVVPIEGRWPANVVHDGSDEVLAGFPVLGKSAGGRIGNAGGGNVPNLPTGAFAAGDPGFGDSGSASRFFYCAKSSTEERSEGNNHPTVKPVALMRWLVRLVTPKGGTVLDPFMGSGSTGIAADAEQFNFIGCELSPEYAAIAVRRIRDAAGMFAEVKAA